MYNILVCDDERDIVNALEIYLSEENYNVIKAYNGLECIQIIEKHHIDLILLDYMMPLMDGIEALGFIRERSNIPVIMLTAKSENDDKIIGLSLGADDYVTKPFNPRELIARVKAQLRRYMNFGANASTDNIKIGGIEVNESTKMVIVDGEKIRCTPSEYDILLLFMKNPNTIFSPEDIYTAIWDDCSYGVKNLIAVHIKHLRSKIEINAKNPRYIKLVWGKGYKFVEPGNSD